MIHTKLFSLILTAVCLLSCSSGSGNTPVAPGEPGGGEPERPVQNYVTIEPEVQSTAVSVVIGYEVRNLEELKNPGCGVCWNPAGNPTVSGMHQDGPALLSTSREMKQVISNALLEYGQTYSFRAYVRSGAKVYYGDEVKGALGREPEALTFNWTPVTSSALPSSVSVYKTTDPLNGHAFNAWYAVADLSQGEVEVKVNIPPTLQTIDRQAAADAKCCVLVNGAYFLTTTTEGTNLGLSVVNGKEYGRVSDYRGSLRPAHPEYDTYYPATRGIFGVDHSGRPAVYWVGGLSVNYYFERPLPSLIGEELYAPVSVSLPAPASAWLPKYAVSAGPVLLYDGKCPFDFTLTGRGEEYYLHNYEMIPYDIFNAGVSPDRTAVGYTADRKVILFVCDGRYAQSGGATLTELAMIMKGLGCVGAVNLDGGGSTGMMVGDEHVNDITTGGNRAVKSTIGFYRK